MSGRHRPQHLSVSPPSPPFRGAGGANSRPFPLPSLTHTRPTPSTRFAANRPIPSPDTFHRAANKETVPTSKCTIPFGLPPKPKTPRFADTHRHNEKARHRPAKRNLGPAVGLPLCDSPTNPLIASSFFIASSPHRFIVSPFPKIPYLCALKIASYG